MDVLMLLSPILVAGLLTLLIVRKKPEFPKAKPGRLWIMLLLTVLLTLAGTYGYYLGAFFLSLPIDGLLGQPWDTVILLLCMLLMAYIIFLTGRGLARLLSLTKKNRLVSLAVMLVLLLAETYAFYVYISGQFI
ncbi:MAG: hypothetical protein J5722_10705 [Oscillospiraceae bacterium]|nr:hypothetical protein [Oscillospiraceae bacterium]